MKTTIKLLTVSLVVGLLSGGPAFAKANIQDKQLEGELKKQTPFVLADKTHGQIRLMRNESFAILGKSRFDIAGSWKVENGKIVLRWQNSDEKLEVDVKNEKDGLRLGGQTKDAKGVYSITDSGTSSDSGD